MWLWDTRFSYREICRYHLLGRDTVWFGREVLTYSAMFRTEEYTHTQACTYSVRFSQSTEPNSTNSINHFFFAIGTQCVSSDVGTGLHTSFTCISGINIKSNLKISVIFRCDAQRCSRHFRVTVRNRVAYSSETHTTLYQTTRRHIPEDNNNHIYRCEGFISHVITNSL
jgi:hypothetical protein